MNHKATRIERPTSLQDVAATSTAMKDFGANLRDWQHEIQRGGIHSRVEFARCIANPPAHLSMRFPDGEIADAYLAAYAEWLADHANIQRPSWCAEKQRTAKNSWFSSNLRGWLIASTPASFRQRNIFTVPENIFTPKAGRPRVSSEQKRKKAQLRQKAYRIRIRALIEKGRSQAPGGDPKPTSQRHSQTRRTRRAQTAN